MRDLLLHTTKYDGSLHYRFAVKLVHESADMLVAMAQPGTMFESYRGSFETRRHYLFCYWLDGRHHDLSIIWNDEWSPQLHYVNIASPTEWDGQTITHDDLDLDLYRRADSDRVVLDDEDEFEHHAAKWRYPSSLIERCRSEVDLARALLEQAEGVFSNRIYAWRPGEDITRYL